MTASRLPRALLATAASALLALAPAVGSAECKADGECKGSRVCEAGACVDPPKKDKPCSTDVDCPGELVCQAKTCAPQGKAPAPLPPRVVAPPLFEGSGTRITFSELGPVPSSPRANTWSAPVMWTGTALTLAAFVAFVPLCVLGCEGITKSGEAAIIVGSPVIFLVVGLALVTVGAVTSPKLANAAFRPVVRF